MIETRVLDDKKAIATTFQRIHEHSETICKNEDEPANYLQPEGEKTVELPGNQYISMQGDDVTRSDKQRSYCGSQCDAGIDVVNWSTRSCHPTPIWQETTSWYCVSRNIFLVHYILNL